jgi:hypothetical protein
MEVDPNKDEVIDLLTKLKSTNGAYPPELLAARRARYLQQVAQVSVAAGAGMGIKEVLKGTKAAGASSMTGTFLEIALVVAIVAEAGALGYIYRDKLAELLNISLHKPRVEQTVNPAGDQSSGVELETTTTPALTATATPIGTPSPVIVINNTVISATEAVNPVNVEPTDRNGNQYGLTPRPERTKDAQGSGTDNGNNNGNNNRP